MRGRREKGRGGKGKEGEAGGGGGRGGRECTINPGFVFSFGLIAIHTLTIKCTSDCLGSSMREI